MIRLQVARRERTHAARNALKRPVAQVDASLRALVRTSGVVARASFAGESITESPLGSTCVEACVCDLSARFGMSARGSG